MQVYNKRSKFLKTEKEKKRWSDLSWEYMTEDSDSDSGNVTRQHKVPWLSKSTYTCPPLIFAINITLLMCDSHHRSQEAQSEVG
jgi:hypothetical protein